VIALSAREAGAALGLAPLCAAVTGVSLDSRTLRPGDLFVALRGERFDAHAFVGEALARGAGGVVVDHDVSSPLPGAAGGPAAEKVVYRVPDTLAALHALARAVRRKSGARVIGLTGSVGKTSTKDILRAMAGATRRVVATAANQNNEVGVPLTLLSIEPRTEVAVIEMGMRGVGQIAGLASVAEPDVGLIVNVAPVHLELLGSLEVVARTKAELLSGLRPGGVGVIPQGCDLLAREAARIGCSLVRFSFGARSSGAEVGGWSRPHPLPGRSTLRVWWPEGEVEVELPYVSAYRLHNTVAAAAACFAAGLPLADSLIGARDTVFSPGRGQEFEVGGVLVVDDSYNANPLAVKAALDALRERARSRPGRALAVLGDMLELGADSRQYHEEVGRYAAAAGVQALWGIGSEAKAIVEGYASAANGGSPGRHEPDLESAVEDVVGSLQPGDVVLVKASRGMRLERMVEAIRQRLGGD